MEYLIIGATSAIAIACARRWAEPSATFTLVGRDERKLAVVRQDLVARGASVRDLIVANLDRSVAEPAFFERLDAICPAPDRVVVAHGTLPDMDQVATDPRAALDHLDVNATSVIALLTGIGARLDRRRSGEIIVLGSVAGDRGRPSNYLYGSAKAAVATFCEGLEPRLAARGVHLLLVKPGFVATPMTAGLQLPQALVVGPERIAHDIDKALARRRHVVYAPFFWRFVMAIIRAIPAPIFRRLKL